MSQLEDLLQQCTIKLTISGGMGWGTGFFVAPGWILTCAHVVQEARGQTIQVRWQSQENWAQAVEPQLLPAPYDLALLRVTFPTDVNPPCVYLDEEIQSRDPLYLFGYPDQDYPNGCPVTFSCEGLTGDEPSLIKFALGQVRPGMSGSPLLNQRTGKVCGIVKFTRDRSTDLGGGALPTQVILEQFPWIKERQQEYHEQDDRWVKLLVENVETPTEQLAKFLAPTPSRPAPEIFIDRVEQNNPILARLLDRVYSKPGQVNATAITGMGGLGKTTTAAWIAWQNDVEKHFVDGRLWVTLGREPKDARTILTDWLHTLGRPDLNPNTIEGARGELGSLLKEKAVLFIIDDVWKDSKETAESLLVAAPKVRYLLTTRNPELVERLRVAVEAFPLDILSPGEALELLKENLYRLKSPLRRDDEHLALQLAETVGYHPLALELAAARVAKGHGWQKLTEVLSQDIAQLQSLEALADRRTLSSAEDEDHRRYFSVRASLRLSLRELPDPQSQCRFAWLGVLAEKAPITSQLGATLWSVDQDDALEILGEFADLNLLTQEGKHCYRMHDLVHDLAREQLTAPEQPVHHNDIPGLGLKLEEASRQLLGAYSGNTICAWHTLNDDGYLYDHLAYHLTIGKLTSELHKLFSNQAWMHVRVPQCSYTYDGYLEDLSIAWTQAKKNVHTQIVMDEEPTGFIDLLRYTLIYSRIRSLLANYVPGLVLRAVETSLWSIPRALSMISKIPEPIERTKMYAALLCSENLSEEERTRVGKLSLSMARTFGDNVYQETPVLVELVPRLSSSLTEEGINLILELIPSPYRPLSQIASKLSGEVQKIALQRAVEAALIIQDYKEKVYALLELVPMLAPEEQLLVLDSAFDTATEIINPKECCHALAAVAFHLKGIKKEAAIVAARNAAHNVDDPKEAIHAYSAIAVHLNTEDKTSWLQEVFKKLPCVHDEKEQAYALDALSSTLTEALWQQALEAARSIHDPVWQAYALIALARNYSSDQNTGVLEQAFIAAKDTEEFSRGWLLATMAPLLRGSLLERVIDAANHIADSRSRAEALVGLGYATVNEQQKILLETALQATEKITDDGAGWAPQKQADFVVAMVPLLKDDLIEKAINLTLSIAEPYHRQQALDALAPRLTGSLLDLALNSALQIPKVFEQLRPLIVLFPYIAEKDQRYVLESLDAILNAPDIRWSSDTKIRVYTDLARFTHGDLQNEILQKGFKAGLDAMKEWSTGEDIEPLVSILTDKSLSWCLEAALDLQNEDYRSKVLTLLATKLSDNLLERIKAAADAIKGEKAKSRLLTALVPQFNGHRRLEVLHEAVEASLSISDPYNRVLSLSQLLAHLQGEDRSRALKNSLAAALKIDYDRSRSHALVLLAPYLEGEFLVEALEAVLVMSSDWRADALAALAPKLPKEQQCDLQKQALESALRLQHKCGPSVQAVVNILDESQFEDSLDSIFNFKDSVCFTYAISAIAPHLTEELLSQTVDEVSTIQEEPLRVAALVELIPYVSDEEIARILDCALELSDSRHQSAGTSGLLSNQTQLLIKLAQHCTSDQSLRILQAVSELKTEEHRVEVLKALTTNLRADTFMILLETTENLLTDWGRSEVLQTIASHLSKDLVPRGLEIAEHIFDKKYSLQALLSFLPVATDQAHVLELVRSALLDYLEFLKDEDFASVLSLYHDTRLFTPPFFSLDALVIIARQIVEISDNWQWL